LTYDKDRVLVKALIKGSERDFNQFFEQYFTRLYRFAVSRMQDEEAVKDIVQTTMMNAIKNLDSYRGEAALFTWLCQICRNEINGYYRKLARSVPEVTADDEAIRPILETLEAGDEFDPEDQFAQLQTRRLIGEVLDFLPYNYGRALEWKYILGLSVGEIAGRLELTDLAAQSLLSRARVAFKEALADISPQLTRVYQE
jgi:RNA polymerase sigma-70 factor (ECF subfamily)